MLNQIEVDEASTPKTCEVQTSPVFSPGRGLLADVGVGQSSAYFADISYVGSSVSSLDASRVSTAMRFVVSSKPCKTAFAAVRVWSLSWTAAPSVLALTAAIISFMVFET